MDINKLIQEEFKQVYRINRKILIKEEYNYQNYGDVYYKLLSQVFDDFLYDNNSDFTKRITWINVPFNLLQSVWEEYMKYGYVKNIKGLDKIERRIYRNIVLIDILTYLSGHSSSDPDDDFHEYFDYLIEGYIRYKLTDYSLKGQLEIDFEKGNGYGKEKQITYPSEKEKEIYNYFDKVLEKEGFDTNDIEDIKENTEEIKEILFNDLKEKFYDYTVDNEGHDILSDYGLEPLQKELFKLLNEDDPNKKIPILDRILNIAHQRSDLAAWLVQGGTSALNALSGFDEIGHEKETANG